MGVIVDFIVTLLAWNIAYPAGYTIVTVPDNSSYINITACASGLSFETGIFKENLTWFQAQQACIDGGYKALDHANPSYVRRKQMRQFLQATNIEFGTYWTDLFRPTAYSTSWFSCMGRPCREFSSRFFTTLPKDEELCSFILFNLTDKVSSVIKMLPANCFEKHFYSCITYQGRPEYRVYQNFDIRFYPDTISEVLDFVGSFDTCLELCNDGIRCSAIVYNNSSSSCKMLASKAKYGILQFEIQPVIENLTFAHKFYCEMKFENSNSSNATTTLDNYSFDLPMCGVPTPSNSSVTLTSITNTTSSSDFSSSDSSTSATSTRLDTSHSSIGSTASASVNASTITNISTRSTASATTANASPLFNLNTSPSPTTETTTSNSLNTLSTSASAPTLTSLNISLSSISAPISTSLNTSTSSTSAPTLTSLNISSSSIRAPTSTSLNVSTSSTCTPSSTSLNISTSLTNSFHPSKATTTTSLNTSTPTNNLTPSTTLTIPSDFTSFRSSTISINSKYSTTHSSVSSTRSGMCFCNHSSTGLSQKDIENIINEMTVPKRNTSKSRRTKTSAYDGRPVAKTIGVFGLIITLTVLSLPIMADVMTWNQHRHKRQEHIC